MPCFIYDMYPAEERSEMKRHRSGKEAMPFAKRRPIIRGGVERSLKGERGHLPI